MFPQASPQQGQGQSSIWQNLLNYLFSRKLLGQQAQGDPTANAPTQTGPAMTPAYSQQDMAAQAQAAAEFAKRQEALRAAMAQKGSGR